MYDILNVYLENGLRVLMQRIPEIKTIACGAWIHKGRRKEGDSRETISYMLEQLMTNMDNQDAGSNIDSLIENLSLENTTCSSGGQLYPFEDKKQNIRFLLTDFSDALESCIKTMLGNIIDGKNLSQEDENTECSSERQKRISFFSSRNIVKERADEIYRNDTGFDSAARDAKRAKAQDGKYKPQEVTLMIVGNVDYQKTLDIIIESFKKVDFNGAAEKTFGRRSGNKPETCKNAILSIGFNICPIGEMDSFKYGENEKLYIEVLARILGDMGLEWRGMSQFRNKKGSLCQFTSFTNFYEDKGRFTYTSVCSMEAVEDVAKFIVSKFNQAKVEGLSEEQIERAQRLVKLNRLLKMKNITSELKFLDKCMSYDQLFSLEKELTTVENVDNECLNNIFKEIIREETLSFEIIGEYNINRLMPALKIS